MTIRQISSRFGSLIPVLFREHRANLKKSNRIEAVRSIMVSRAGTLALRSPDISETVS
jgi:hypothetical protein